MRKSKRTPEERAEWSAKLKTLADQVRAMSEDERQAFAARAGTVTAEGRPLSPFNCIFLANQAGRICAQVGGYQQWQKAGRQVVKGCTAVGRIWVPTRGKEDPNKQAGEISSAERTRFVTVPVFDITQTEPMAEGGAA